VLLHNAAFGIEHKRSGERGDAAVLNADFAGGEGDGIVDAKLRDEFPDGVLIVVVHDEAENLEAVFVFVLELDEIGNFRAAGSAPGGPGIQKDDFAARVRERNGFAIEAGELEAGCGIGVADEADDGLLLLPRN